MQPGSENVSIGFLKPTGNDVITEKDSVNKPATVNKAGTLLVG